MGYSDQQVNLVINKLSRNKYDEITRLGQVSSSEIYYILDSTNPSGNSQPMVISGGFNHTASEITGWEDVNLSFNNLSVSSFSVNGKQVSIDGHTHMLSEIVDLSGADLNLGQVSANAISMGGAQVATESYVDSAIQSIDIGCSVFVTDSEIGWTQSKANLNVVKVTPSEYQQYLNNYTQQELANYVFIVSSNVEDMLGKRVTNVGTPTSDTDAATKGYVDSALDGFTPTSGQSTDDYIQLIKPIMDDARLYVEISFYSDFEMTTPLFTIDSNDVSELQYFRAYHNSGTERAWLVPDAEGLTSDYDYSPVCVLVKKYMTDNNITSTIKCASFYWYWIDGSNVEHKSDVCSSIFPASSELNMGKLMGYEEMESSGTTTDGQTIRFKMLIKRIQ